MRAWPGIQVALVLIVACGLSLAACSGDSPDAARERLIGTWVLDRDCGLEQVMAMTRRNMDKLVADAADDEKESTREFADELIAGMEPELKAAQDAFPDIRLTFRDDGTCDYAVGAEVTQTTWAATVDGVTLDLDEPVAWRMHDAHLLLAPEAVICLSPE